jgi:hypothetical protein
MRACAALLALGVCFVPRRGAPRLPREARAGIVQPLPCSAKGSGLERH